MPKYPSETVIVEYDSRGKRVKQMFTDHYKAKRFYVSKHRAGKRPKVRRATGNDSK